MLYRFYHGDTLSVQTSTSNDTKSSSNSLEGGKRYKLSHRQRLDTSLEEHCFESEEQSELSIQVARQHDKESRTVIDNDSIKESNNILLFWNRI